METTEVRGIRIERATAGGFLGGMIFLVKFFFTNERMVPPGIPMKARDSAALDRYHAALAQMLGQGFLAEIGRVRTGCVDTGEPVFGDNPPRHAHAGVLRKGFGSHRLVLVEPHYFTQAKPRPGKREPVTKHVVCLTYVRLERSEFSLPDLPSETRAALRQLAETTWGFCHVWQNPNNVHTLNFVQREPGIPPQNAVVVRNHTVTVIPTAGFLAEQDE